MVTIVVLGVTAAGCGSAEDVAETSAEPTLATESSTSALTTTVPSSPATTAPSAPTSATVPTTAAASTTAATTATTSAITTAPTATTPSPTSTSATPTSRPRKPEVAARPKVGNCYDTGKAAFQRQRDDSEPVSCRRRHTAETFAVFRFESFPNAAKVNAVGRRCNARFKRYVGGSPTISKLGLTVMLPGSKLAAAGQNWVRCDVIELANYNGKGGVPRTGSVKGVLNRGVPLAFRGCVRHWPKVDQPVHFTSCQRRHQAALIPESLNLGGPNAEYPGRASVIADSKAFCETTVLDYVPQARNYYYYYPKLSGWRSGTRDTTCWALDREGDGLPPL